MSMKKKRAIDVKCPQCGARPGRPCKSSRTPTRVSGLTRAERHRQSRLKRPHKARYEERKRLALGREEDRCWEIENLLSRFF